MLTAANKKCVLLTTVKNQIRRLGTGQKSTKTLLHEDFFFLEGQICTSDNLTWE